eukprot:s187_g29.t1
MKTCFISELLPCVACAVKDHADGIHGGSAVVFGKLCRDIMKQQSPKTIDEPWHFLERLGQSHPLILGLVPREGGHHFGPKNSSFQPSHL